MVRPRGDVVLAGARATEGWVRVLVALDAIVGAILLLAGVYLLDPGLADLGLYVEGPKYLILGGVLVAAGLVLAQAAIFGLAPRTNVLADFLGQSALWCAGALLSVLAVRALVSGDSSIAWLAVLAVPGALAFATLRALRLADAIGEAPVPALGPGSGRLAHGRPGELFGGAVIVVLGIYGLTTIVVGSIFAYLLLDISFVGDRAVNAVAVFATFAALYLKVSLILIPLVAGFALTGALALAAWRRFERERRSDFNRDLSAEETSFTESCVRETEAYIAQHRLRALAQSAREAFAGWFWLFAVAAVVAALFVSDFVASIYAPPGEGWQLYLTEGADAAAVFVALFSLSVLPGALARLFSMRMAEAGGLRALGAHDGAAAMQEVLVRLVRRRVLKPGEAFDPGSLLRGAGRSTAGVVAGWNAILAVALVLWWPHERAQDTLYTEQWIETGDFWTMERRRFAYDAVESVRLECSGNVSYRIALPDGARRELLSEYRFGSRLQDAAKIDEKLRSAGVRFGFVLPGEAPSDTAGVVDRECVEGLMEGMEPAERAAAERVLHLDAWFERRWRKRTGALSVSRQ